MAKKAKKQRSSKKGKVTKRTPAKQPKAPKNTFRERALKADPRNPAFVDDD